MNAAQVVQRENFIGNTIYLIIGISVGIAAAIIGAFSVTVVRDLKKLNATANEISQGNTNVIVNVKRKDEIGELADSFSRMVASLKFMMSEQDETKKSITGSGMTELSDKVLKAYPFFIGPASSKFLERQTKSHMNGAQLQ